MSIRSKLVQLPGLRVTLTVSVAVGVIVDGASNFTAGRITEPATAAEL
jgi:hypothetical protein